MRSDKACSFAQGNMKALTRFVEELDPHAFKTHWYKSLLSVQEHEFNTAQEHIDKARNHLVAHLSPLLRENYSAAYEWTVFAQMLSELQEVIVSLTSSSPSSLERVYQAWRSR